MEISMEIFLLEVCLSREVCFVSRAVIGHLSVSGKGRLLLIPRVKEAQSDWRSNC
jgi:hypothetical protein